MSNLIILDELRDLIPPLAKDERDQLEENIIRDGCREPLAVWKTANCDILLDGHNRLEICERNGIDYETERVAGIETQDQAVEWMVYNQIGRRNLEPFEKCRLVMPLEKIVAERAKENQGTRTDLPGNIVQNSAQSKTRDQMAALAGVSHDTYNKSKKIEEKADEETKALLSRKKKDGGISINEAYKRVRKEELQIPEQTDEEIQEIARAKRNVKWLCNLGRSIGQFPEHSWESWERKLPKLTRDLKKEGTVFDYDRIIDHQKFLKALAYYVKSNQK